MIKYVLAFIALLYVLIPYDFLPDFMVGWGWIDDLIVLWLLWRFFKTQVNKPSGYQNYYNKQTHQKTAGSSDAPDRKPAGSQDPYTVLNIERNATPAEIKQAYRKLAAKYHPDKVQHLGEEFRKLAEERFKEIEKAYRELTN